MLQVFHHTNFRMMWGVKWIFLCLSGLIMMGARGLSEFGAVVIIAYHPMVTPVMIYDRFNAYGLKYARPVAALFILVCLTLFVLLRLLARKKNHARS